MGKPEDNRARVEKDILEMVAKIYQDKKRTPAELLAFDPNDIDMLDPSLLYELLVERYGVDFDPDNDFFGGFGGPISHTIDFIASRWDGKTLNPVEMPPLDGYFGDD